MKKTGGSNKAGGSKEPNLASFVPKGPFGRPSENPCTPKGARRTATNSQAESFTPRRQFEQVGEGEATAKLRKMIAERMKEETVYVTDEHFRQHYLPTIPKRVRLARVVKDLKDSKYLEKEQEHKQNLLGKFAIKPTDVKAKEKSATNEKIIFAPLTDVAAAIRQSVDASKNLFRLRMVPDTELKSSIRGCTFRVDACTTPTEPQKGSLHVTDIVVPFEFKISNGGGDQQKNRRQVVSAIVHIMNDDVRRNFMYAVTIENDRVSMWYFSRTHSVKATSFSFVDEPKKLVHLLVSLSCATEEQLGFDRRITLLPDMSFLYEFPPTREKTDASSKEPADTAAAPTAESSTVDDATKQSAAADAPPTAEGDAAPQPGPIYYKTTAAISEFRAYRVAGRTTRIFKSIQVVSKEKPDPVPGAEVVVVKDIWIGVDSPSELQIQQQLFKDIQNLPTKYKGGIGKHRLLKTFKEHEIGELKSLLSEDRFKDLFLCAESESVGQGSKPVHPKAWDSDKIFVAEDPVPGESYPGSGDRISLSIPPTTAPQPGALPATDLPSSRRGFSPKKRCFYVFKQVCTRVSALPTLGDAIGVLRHTFLALTLMFCAGWVHRDISHGNVLALSKDGGKTWQGKLADLEYARRFPFDDAGSTDPKTGTPYFMAYEIQSTFSLYAPNKGTRGFDAPRDSKKVNTNRTKKGAELKAVKKHTYAHDLESLWWLLLFILTNLLSHLDSYQKAYIYFQLNNLSSRLALLNQGTLPITDTRVEDFLVPLDDVRDVLMNGYELRDPEVDPAADPEEQIDSYRGAVVVFYDFFATIKDSQATWKSIELQDPPSRSTQRVAPTSAIPRASTSIPQVLATTQSGSRKRKDMEESANPKPTVRRSTRRATVKAPEDPDADADGPGPSKKTRT